MWDSKGSKDIKEKKPMNEKKFETFDWGGGGEPAPLVFKTDDDGPTKKGKSPNEASDGTIGKWNQFDAKANISEREKNEAQGGKKAKGGGGGGSGKDHMYGLMSGSQVDQTKFTDEEKARAALLAKEIVESDATGGIHQLLERGEENIAEYEATYGSKANKKGGNKKKSGGKGGKPGADEDNDLEAMEAKRAGLVDKYNAGLEIDDAELYSDVQRPKSPPVGKQPQQQKPKNSQPSPYKKKAELQPPGTKKTPPPPPPPAFDDDDDEDDEVVFRPGTLPRK